MSKINMKGATPNSWNSLCNSCSQAHIVTGFRESELVVICTHIYPSFVVPFKVQECTSYLDRNRPDYNTMTKLAIHVEPASTLKPVGFRTKVTVIDEDETEELND
jgi:uncharacterized cysteine cluster protein YcgN (CxxCxxCC family)